MEKRELTCINCPMGCQLTVTLEDGAVVSVTGQTCKRGEVYAHTEVTAPVRTVTSTVRINGGRVPMLSVKTAAPVPKSAVPAVLLALRPIVAQAPVHIGDVILPNAAGLGVDVVATSNS